MVIMNMNECNKYKNNEIEILKKNHLYKTGTDCIELNQTYDNIFFTLLIDTNYLSKKMKRRLFRLGYKYEGYLTVELVKKPMSEVLFEVRKGNLSVSTVTEINKHVFKKSKLKDNYLR